MDMQWYVGLTNKAEKQKHKLPQDVQYSFMRLTEDLKCKGGYPGSNWPNYSKLRGLKGQKKDDDWRHCHLQKGSPTYVCCWQVFEDTNTIEVYYVGTHENAPY